jgi:predicted small integral membrane protein
MKAHRKGTVKKMITWIVAEVVLNAVGLDNLADYSEFVFEHHPLTMDVQNLELKIHN